MKLVKFVNGLDFQTEVVSASLPVLIDVTAPWCAPCRAAAPVIDELVSLYSGRLKVVAIDGEQAPELVADLAVRGFPTFLGLVRGEVVLRQAGFGGRIALLRLADTLLGLAQKSSSVLAPGPSA